MREQRLKKKKPERSTNELSCGTASYGLIYAAEVPEQESRKGRLEKILGGIMVENFPNV